MSVAEVTGFGAAWADPARTASVLRAKAVAAGVAAASVACTDPVDLAAAVVGAHVWACALGAQSLSEAAQFGPGERAAAASVLARACGLRPSARPVAEVVGQWADLEVGAAPVGVLAEVARAVAWAEDVLEGQAAGLAMAAAAVDLLDSASQPLRAAGAALLAEADRD